MSRAPLPILGSLSSGYRQTLLRLRSTLVLVAVVQGAVALIAAPLLVGMFTLAARSSGLIAVTDTTAGALFGSPLGVTIVVVSLLLTVAAALTQLAVFAVVARHREGGGEPGVRTIAAQLRQRLIALARRPSTLVLIPYLILLLPLGHVGFGSVLTRWVSIPAFVSDELLKSPTTTAIYVGFLLIVWWLNLRFVFALPLLVLGEGSAPGALAASWRLTRWRSIRVVGLLLGVAVPLTLALTALGIIAVLPTVLSDAVAPEASVVVAAIGLALLQVLVFFLVGVSVMVQMQALVHAAGAGGALRADAPEVFDAGDASDASAVRTSRTAARIVAAGALATVVALTVAAIGPLSEVADGSTEVLGHRGFSDGGVENTLSALEAANRAGADLVEMDVLQTKDGSWVVMHDTTLSRLAGQDVAVADLTLDELTRIEVHDAAGHVDTIPSLEAYLRRAKELDQELLIEIKTHGKETPDYVAELIAFIDEVDDADAHIYHSLVSHVVEEFSTLRPDLTIGYILALSFTGVPESPADFLVLEQSAYDREKRDMLWDRGQGVFVWTVQDAAAMREFMRDNVDGIITDHPDVALTERDGIRDDIGVAARLQDAVDRLLVNP
ncbi:glycerophosphoryl diester phosphodiesterase membrane domain-containing protein [Microbacterium keratanolyticum]|uniref:glycerophosphoryl diester phosphodiesterase membrane domain-containing protein n=1 Tax=Microbacterium keratanolyticum TaxID=67574 RepID=UPI003637B7EA